MPLRSVLPQRVGRLSKTPAFWTFSSSVINLVLSRKYWPLRRIFSKLDEPYGKCLGIGLATIALLRPETAAPRDPSQVGGRPCTHRPSLGEISSNTSIARNLGVPNRGQRPSPTRGTTPSSLSSSILGFADLQLHPGVRGF